MNLDELKNKKILLLGKSRAFSSEEFLAQMKHHKIEVAVKFSDDIATIVEGKMITPYEQNLSDELYETKKIKFIAIDELEKQLAQEIDSKTLLMSLKLSHDKQRLKDFITNAMISDALFFKLMKLYDWKNEDFFENDDNRDVSAAFIVRFYENIERNHNIEFATTGFIHLVAQAKDTNLLKEIAALKPLKYHPKIESAIAMSIYCDSAMQKRFFKQGKENILEALSYNKKLDIHQIKEYLKMGRYCENIAYSVLLNEELFTLLEAYKPYLASNESLTYAMQENLLAIDNETIHLALSANNNLDERIINKLFSLKNHEIENHLLQNSATPAGILEEAYKDSKNHLFLAKNENTPIEILYQLELHSKYSRFVKSNAGYAKHIQTHNIGWL